MSFIENIKYIFVDMYFVSNKLSRGYESAMNCLTEKQSDFFSFAILVDSFHRC